MDEGRPGRLTVCVGPMRLVGRYVALGAFALHVREGVRLQAHLTVRDDRGELHRFMLVSGDFPTAKEAFTALCRKLERDEIEAERVEAL